MENQEVSEYDVVVSRAVMHTKCKNCNSTMVGDMDSDQELFKLECEDCGFKASFKTAGIFWLGLEAAEEG